MSVGHADCQGEVERLTRLQSAWPPAQSYETAVRAVEKGLAAENRNAVGIAEKGPFRTAFRLPFNEIGFPGVMRLMFPDELVAVIEHTGKGIGGRVDP